MAVRISRFSGFLAIFHQNSSAFHCSKAFKVSSVLWVLIFSSYYFCVSVLMLLLFNKDEISNLFLAKFETSWSVGM